jgi:GAF domain-containing protein
LSERELPDHVGLPADHTALAMRLTMLTRALLDADTVAELLHRVVSTAYELLPGADLASVTLRADDGTFHTPVETESLATALDQIQYDTGEGPCVTAALPDGPASATTPDLAAEPRWPTFGPAAARLGMGSVLSTALVPDAMPPRLSGALNIYSRRTFGFDDADRDVALLLATHGSLALARTRAVTEAELRETQLRQAIESRDVIGQAKGILMTRRGLNADQAFDLLRRTSQDLNVRLVELARTLAHRHTELDNAG